MFTAVFLSAVALAAPVPKATKPVGPPPKFVYVAPAADGRVQVTVRFVLQGTEPVEIVVKNGVTTVTKTAKAGGTAITTVTLDKAAMSFATAGDQKLTAEEANAKLKAGGVIVAPTDGDEVDPVYLKALSADAIVATYTGKEADRKTLVAYTRKGDEAVPTVPKFVAVKADDKGVVMIPAVGTKEVTVTVTEAKVENGVTTTVQKPVKQTVSALVPTPLDEVKPDATTADGKPVAADEAKKRLAAGALVLVSGDGQPVDEVFRKLVKPDTLVLASPKMVLPGAGGRAKLQLAVPAVPVAPPPPAK